MSPISGNPATDPLAGGLRDERRLARAAWEIARRGSLAAGLSDPESDIVGALGAADTMDAPCTAGNGSARAREGDADRLGIPACSTPAGAPEGTSEGDTDRLVSLIASGHDPLGDALMRLRSPVRRRRTGAFYTPAVIVSSMVDWAARRCRPARVVDPGAGSARFLLAAGRALPSARLVGVEIDPLAALLARANLTAAGLDHRSRVVVGDYRTAQFGPATGPTAFIGNPPYVRHHQIDPEWKAWLADSAASLGLRASRLAGLHVHFLVATAMHARCGDVGAFVTSAEWLDVNYGKLPRELLTTVLGGLSVHLIDPEAEPFEGTATTAAVSCFEAGSTAATITLGRVRNAADLGRLNGGESFSREHLAKTPRWSPLLNPVGQGGRGSRGAGVSEARRNRDAPPSQRDDPPSQPVGRGGRGAGISKEAANGLDGNPRRSPLLSGSKRPPSGHIELGEICRVHRGAVTGANSMWITDTDDPRLPLSVLFPSITRAAELFGTSGGVLSSAAGLRAVIDLPSDLDMLDAADRRRIERFLRAAESQGVHCGYIARHRNPWWSVGLRAPAPILATYMARRPPAFVRNPAQVRNVNVAHGIYPREPMPQTQLDALATALRAAAPSAQGRTYAGGLIKFEPSEMARIRIPHPETLQEATPVNPQPHRPKGCNGRPP